MIYVPKSFRNRLEDVTNLCNTILLPIVVQVCEFHKKSEKLKKKKLWQQTRELQKWLCRRIYRELIITHTALAHWELSKTSKMEYFANMADY